MGFKIHEVRLGDICAFRAGSAFPRDNQGKTKGDHPFIKVSDMNAPENSWIISRANNWISSSEAHDLKAKLQPKGATVFAKIGEALKADRTRLLSRPTLIDNNMMAAVPKESIDPLYLYYLITSLKLSKWAEGSALPYLKQKVLGDIVVRIPVHVEDQQRTSSILELIDRKIRINQRTNDYLSELIEAIFVEWFVRVNSRYPTKKVLMDEIAFVNAGGDKPDVWQKCQTEEFPIPIFSNGIDNEGLYGYTTTAKITKPSITVSARGTIGFTCLRHEPYYPIVRLVSATPRDYVTAEYLYLWVKRATVIGVGTTQQQLTVPMFKNYEVDVPDATSMEEFTRVTTPLFKMVDANKAENRKLSELRNALLPKLISGEVDISKVVI